MEFLGGNAGKGIAEGAFQAEQIYFVDIG
jgi:hypothetical protein